MMPRRLAVLPLAALLLSACVSDRGRELGPTDPQLLYDSWTLTELEGNPIDTLLPAGARRPSLSIGPDGTVGGHTSVNSLGTKVDLEGLQAGKFKLGGIITTRMAGPPALMAVEAAYTEALGKVDSYRVDEGAMTLTQGDQALLVFARNEQPDGSTAN